MPNLLVLVEGPTEEILLPYFAQQLNSDFTDKAIFIMACGGSKQLLKKYLSFRETTKLGMVCIFDHDAINEIEITKEMLRPNDFIHVWTDGEIEDIFSLSFLIEYINKFLNSQGISNYITGKEFELYSSKRRITVLDKLFQERGLGKFDKTGFAHFIKNNYIKHDQIPKPAREIIKLLDSLATKQIEDQKKSI